MPTGPKHSDTPFDRPWAKREPGQVIGRGHPVGDFLEAPDWKVLERDTGVLRLRAHLLERVMNPRGQLFGGFTPTYVDLVSLLAVRSVPEPAEIAFDAWLATTNMRIDYFEPVLGPEFEIDSRLTKQRGRTLFVETRFFDRGELAVFALTTLRKVPMDRALGDG